MEKPNYGIDAPGFIKRLLAIGLGFIVLGYLIKPFDIAERTIHIIGPLVMSISLLFFALAFSMILYVKIGKYNMRNIIVSRYAWKGDEQVLDVGTGRGLLMVAIAKKLQTGKAIGIDIWKDEDLTGNTMPNVQLNMELEGVMDRSKIISADVRKMSFPNHSFDVVVSLMCLHNIRSQRERDIACDEMYRVLKPGGKIIIADYTKVDDYARSLKRTGMQVSEPENCFSKAFSTMYLIEATKNP